MNRFQTNQAIAAAMTTMTTVWIEPTTSPTCSQRSPSSAPAPMSARFQIAEPSAVKSTKRQMGMRRKPAGIDTRERTSGTHRQTSTATSERRSNQDSARSRSASLTPSQRP